MALDSSPNLATPLTQSVTPARCAWCLPDASAGIFAPGWDVGLVTTDPELGSVAHLAAYRLGSPFPEDAKLCAALSSFWPAVASDSAQAYPPNVGAGPTVKPMLDQEIGKSAGFPWDGVPAPKKYVANYAPHRAYETYFYTDYTENALNGKFSLALTGKVDSQEYQRRIDAFRRVKLSLSTTPGNWFIDTFSMATPDSAGRYDVIIIGAGPAGCSAAICCAQQGLKVALIERLSFPRHRPGETLHPGLEPLLQQLGVAEKIRGDAFVRPAGTWVRWDTERHFVPFGQDQNGPWRGFQIPRAMLDGLLLDRAAASGVHVLQPCQAKTVLQIKDRVVGLQTQAGQLFCRHLIDASGAHGWLARQLRLTSRRCSPPLTAVYGYKRGTVQENTLGIFADPSGWYWTAHIGQQLYHWTRLRFMQDKSPKMAAVPACFEHLPCEGTIRGADVTWSICDQAAGKGYFIIGDAASRLDPGASHGVLKALMSGMMAAQCIADESLNPTHRQAISLQYCQWLRDWFERDVQKMRDFYAAHPFPPCWLESMSANGLSNPQQK